MEKTIKQLEEEYERIENNMVLSISKYQNRLTVIENKINKLKPLK